MSPPDRRAYERIEYRTGAPPLCRMGVQEATVLDCSERGVRLATSGAGWPDVSEEFKARIEFPGGTATEVEGVVVRREPGELAVLFTARWIPRDVILAEQRRVRLAMEAEAPASQLEELQ